jgi:hypothetical protein
LDVSSADNTSRLADTASLIAAVFGDYGLVFRSRDAGKQG